MLEYISVIVSVLALSTSAYALWQNKISLKQNSQSKRSIILNEITQQANLVNNSTITYGIRGPYAVLRGLLNSDDKQEISDFEALGATFLHQINMLSIVYNNRDTLGDITFVAYKKWIATVFRPWVESDDHLIWYWRKLKETQDFLGADFIKWLDCELNIHREKAH